MRLIIKTNNQEMSIAIKVKALEQCDIMIEAYDQENPKTYFLTRHKIFTGVCVFKIKLPISPKTLIVNIYNAKNGNLSKGKDNSFIIESCHRETLEKYMSRVAWSKYNLKDFVDFACRLCYNLSYLKPNVEYKSDKNNFIVELLPTITDANGKELNTPARINKSTGKIQISKKAFDMFTVPQRMAILCHEISHYHINSNPDDESEADLNGLTIYLALGFPTVEAYDAFADVFTGAPTEQNKKRYEIIDKFIRTFEKQKIVLQ